MISTELRAAYNFHRAGQLACRALKADMAESSCAYAALAFARRDITNGKTRHTSSPWRKPVGNSTKTNGAQWIESPASMGLRFVGYCDKLSEIGHTGWFTDAYQDDKIRGVVYQLPGRDGKARFVAGHDNHDNSAADNGGPAYIDWSQIFESDFVAELAMARRQIGKAYWTTDMDRPAYWAEAAHETARKEAARAADEFTRIEAEEAAEYNRAWQAGVQYAESLGERAEAKTELRALLIERRVAKALASDSTVSICRAVESKARDLIETIAEVADKARKLADGEGGDYVSFWTGDAKLRAAFNDGAGVEILA